MHSRVPPTATWMLGLYTLRMRKNALMALHGMILDVVIIMTASYESSYKPHSCIGMDRLRLRSPIIFSPGEAKSETEQASGQNN